MDELIKNPFYHYTYTYDKKSGKLNYPDIYILDKSLHKRGILYPVTELNVSVKVADTNEISFNFYSEYDNISQIEYPMLKTGTIVYVVGFGFFKVKVTEKEDSNGKYKSVSGSDLCEMELSNILVTLEINNENDVQKAEYEGDTLETYTPTVFYRNPNDYNEYQWTKSEEDLSVDNKKQKLKDSSLLHRILSYAPHYSIGHIDKTLYYVQRTFSWSNQSINDVLNEIAEEVGCIFTFETYLDDDGNPVRQLNAYEKTYCQKCYKESTIGLGYKTFNTSKFRSVTNGICDNCGESKYIYDYGEDTGIFIDTEKLTDEITIDPDNEVKNVFKITGGDDVITSAVQSLNFGSNKIMMFSNDELDEMSESLRGKIESYKKDQENNQEKFDLLIEIQSNIIDLINYLKSSKMPYIVDSQKRDLQSEIYYLVDKINTDWECNFYFPSYENGEMNYKNNAYTYSASQISKMFKLYLDEGYAVSVSNGDLDGTRNGKEIVFWNGVITIKNSSDSKDYADIHVQKNGTSYVEFNNIFVNDGEKVKFDLPTFFVKMIFADENPDYYAKYISQYCEETLSQYREVKYKNEVRKDWNEYCYERLISFRDGYQSCIELLENLRTQYPEFDNEILKVQTNYTSFIQEIQIQLNYLIEQINALYRYWGNYTYTTDDYGNRTYSPDFVSENYKVDYKQVIGEMTGKVFPFREDFRVQKDPISCQKCGSSNVGIMYDSENNEHVYCKSCGNTDESKITTYYDLVCQVYNSFNTVVENVYSDIVSIANQFKIENYFTESEYKELYCYIKEQEYNNSNYTSDACNTNQDIIAKAKELILKAKKELSIECEQQLSISSNSFALLAQRYTYNDENFTQKYIDSYEKFTLGNWIRVGLKGENFQKVRLTSIDFSFDTIESLPLEFSKVTKSSSGILSDLKSVVKQSSSISSTYSYVTHQAEKGSDASTKLDNILTNGYDSALAAVLAGDNQEITMDKHGLLFRKYLDGVDTYSKYQMKMINRNIVMSDDAFKTAKLAIGLGVLPDGTLGYGIWADNIIGGDITCTKNLRIIGANGSVVIDGDRIHFDDGTISSSAVSGLDDSLKDFVDSIGNLQSQIDGEITSWFEDYDPSADNEPASTWETDSDKIKHEGDLFYNTATGRAFRYIYNSSTKNHEWSIVTDEAISKALADAATAKDTADCKRRVFVDTPYVPYDVGDLWTQGNKGDLYKCKTAKTDKQTYSPDDWEKATKYTDDTKANEIQKDLSNFKSDVEGCFGTTITSDAVISPKIGGGYLYLTEEMNGNGGYVEIDPSNKHSVGNKIIDIGVKNSDESSSIFYITNDGSGYYAGKIESGGVIDSNGNQDVVTIDKATITLKTYNKQHNDTKKLVLSASDGIKYTDTYAPSSAPHTSINPSSVNTNSFSGYMYYVNSNLYIGNTTGNSCNHFAFSSNAAEYYWKDSGGHKYYMHGINDTSVFLCQYGGGKTYYGCNGTPQNVTEDYEIVNKQYLKNNYQAKTSSDFRLKKDIRSMENIDEIYLSFKPKFYRFKDEKVENNEKIRSGLLAQQVIAILQENDEDWKQNDLVEEYNCREYMDEGQYTGDTAYRINYENLHAYHIAFAQSMYKKIETLEKQNKEKDEKINDLEQRLSKLESLLLSKEGGDIE